jgi:hypothetical protein
MFPDSIDFPSRFINFIHLTTRRLRHRVDLTWIKCNSSDIQSIFHPAGEWSLLTYVREARKYKQARERITLARARGSLPCVRSRILNILITGSLFHFPLDYRRYLHVVAARARLPSPPIYPSAVVFFPRAICVFLARACFHALHTFPRPAKSDLGCVPVRTAPLFFWLIIAPS